MGQSVRRNTHKALQEHSTTQMGTEQKTGERNEQGT